VVHDAKQGKKSSLAQEGLKQKKITLYLGTIANSQLCASISFFFYSFPFPSLSSLSLFASAHLSPPPPLLSSSLLTSPFSPLKNKVHVLVCT
jgi:hypothetical protein